MAEKPARPAAGENLHLADDQTKFMGKTAHTIDAGAAIRCGCDGEDGELDLG